MTLKSSPPPLTRTAERAALRRGPAWSAWDLLLPALLTVFGLLTAFVPGLLADLGDTIIGSERYVPELGTSVAGLLAMLIRWLVVGGVGIMLLLVREAPLAQRQAWTVVAIGILMNLSRNVYSGNSATLSFVIIQVGLLWLLSRLSLRPTVWQQWQEERARADAEAARADAEADRADRAEAELARLKGTA